MTPEFNILARSLWESFERVQFGNKRDLPPIFGNMQMEVIALDNAREAQEFRFFGDFLFADSDSTGTVYVQINGPTMPKFPFKASTGIKGFPYRTLSISNIAQAGKVVHLWYGYGAQIIPPNQDIASISSIVNPVNLDPEDARYFLFGDDETADGEAFHANSSAGAVAAQVAFVQLFNPAASGKILYIDAFDVGDGTAADRIEMRQHNAAIGALINTGVNKNDGGAAGVAQFRAGASAAPGGTVIRNFIVAVNTELRVSLKAPIRLTEGRGISLISFTVNHAIIGGFEWREKLT